MLKLQICIQQISLKLKIPQNDNHSAQIYLKFYCQQNNISILIKDNVLFTSQLQLLDINHIIHVKKSQVKDKRLKYKVILIYFQSQNGKKMIKNVGDCELELKFYDISDKQLPIGFQNKVFLKKCPNKQAYLKFKTIFRQIEEFNGLFDTKSTSRQEDNIQDSTSITQQQILSQQQSQLISQIKKNNQSLKSRNNRLQQQITRLNEQNDQLQSQIKQRKQAMKMNQQLQQDKLDSLIQKNIKHEEQYKKVKENIGKVFNLINEYGRVDVIEEISNLLAD